VSTGQRGAQQERGRYPLARPFPRPGPLIALAYHELEVALDGDDVQRRAIGNLEQLVRPWDPGSIEDPPARKELWQWLEAVVDWVNTEHVWDPSCLVPPCWPAHPHLVHEIATLADRRLTAGQALTGDALEEWHRYVLPAFFDRRRTRLRTACDSRHQDWPARPAHIRYQDDSRHREQHYAADVDHHRQLLQSVEQPQHGPLLHVVDGPRIDPQTGEVR
jgi:hypothetical protein